MPTLGWRVALIALAYLSLFALAFIDNLRGPYFPNLLRDLKLTDTEGGWFFAMASALAFLASWFTQHSIIRWGSVKTLSVGVWIAGIAGIAFSFSTRLIDLLLYSAIFGVGFGLISVAMNVAVADGSPIEWRRRVLSGLHSVYGLASLCSPLLVTVLEHFGFSWRQGFAIGAIPAVLIGIYSLSLFGRKDLLLPAQGPATSEANKGDVASDNKFWALWMGFAVAIYLFGELSLSTRLVLYLVRSYEWNLSHSSLYLSGFFAGLFLSRVSLLFIKVKWSSLHLFYSCLGLSIVCFSLGLIFHPVFLSLCGFCMGPFVPTAVDHLMQTFSPIKSEVVSYTMAFFSLVVVILHFALGWVTDMASIDVALWMGPVAMFFSASMYTYGLLQVRKSA